MKTIIYNTDTQQFISGIFPDRYRNADGQLSPVYHPLVQLEYISTEPIYNPITEIATLTFTIVVNPGTHDPLLANGTATELWTVRNKTPEELTIEAQNTAIAIDNDISIANLKKHILKSITFENNEEMLQAIELFPAWQPGLAVTVDQIYQHNNQLYKVIQAHTTQLDWPPDIVPALFLNIAAPGTIPEWVQPTGAHDAYNIGDQVLFQGHVYESLINANVWSPTAYPQGWQLIS